MQETAGSNPATQMSSPGYSGEVPRLPWEQEIASSILATQIMEPILVWKFDDAPEELQKISTNGGDEDWLAKVPPELKHEWIPWIEVGGFGVCDIDRYELEDGSVVFIGCHA